MALWSSDASSPSHPGGRKRPRCIRHPRAGRLASGVALLPPSPSLMLAVTVPVPAQMKQYHSLHWVDTSDR